MKQTTKGAEMEMRFTKRDYVLYLDHGDMGAIIYAWPTETAFVGELRETDEYFTMNRPQETTKAEAGRLLHRLIHRRGGACSAGSGCEFWSEWTETEKKAQLAFEAECLR